MSPFTTGLYAYPEPNSVLLANLSLQPHPEGQPPPLSLPTSPHGPLPALELS